MGRDDLTIVPLTGATRDGKPLSFGRAPAEDLRPWFARMSVSKVVIPEGRHISCRMLSDHPVIRVLFGARWTAHTADGELDFAPEEEGQTLFFGPHSQAMPLVVHGSFTVITLNFAAGSTHALGAPSAEQMIDRIADYDEIVGHGKLSTHFAPGDRPKTWLETLESDIRRFVTRFSSPLPDPLIRNFEAASLTDPSLSIREFAEEQRITPRTLERVVKRDYGMAPKQVLRRARAMDMAAMLLGVAMEEEEAEIRLRYFDQSHLNREMRHFFAMTPRQLRDGAHPLLRITMEIRQSRRVEALAFVGIDQPMPWRDPAAEPSAD